MSKEEDIIKQDIVKTLELNYMPYAMSVIVSRAIPEIDGFKPAHRKLLYTMYKMGLTSGNRIKCADVVGQTMRLNPHGDTAIYETLVRLTRGNAALIHPFIDSKGNLGKHYSRDMAYAASRYTEVKLEDISKELFREIDREGVEFEDNYNSTTKEPKLLPTPYPNILVTSNQGIAVGMASAICSFNLEEVCRATIAYIKDSQCELEKYLKGPDFSTGGELIYNKEETAKIYKTGNGSFEIQGKYRYDKENSCIEIYEIPYTTTIEVIIEKIISLVRENKIKEIVDVRDETDLNGLKIAIDVRKNSDIERIMKKVYRHTSLRDKYKCNFNILVEGRTKRLGIAEILEEWIKFRIKTVRNVLRYEIRKKEEKLHLTEGLKKILEDIEEVIRIIRETEEDKKVVGKLMERYDLNEIQGEYIAEIKLRNLNKEYMNKKVKEEEELRIEIKQLKKKEEDEAEIKLIIAEELKQIIKKYKKERRTAIIREEDISRDIETEDMIEDYEIKVILTRENYLKKMKLQQASKVAMKQYIKEGDEIRQEIECNNNSTILMFSSEGNVYKVKAYDIVESKASSIGEYLPNKIGLSEEERVFYIASTKDYEGHMLFGYENGKISKIDMKSYSTKVNRRKLMNGFSSKSKVIFAEYIQDERDYVAIRNSDKAVLFSTEILGETKIKNSSGIQVFKLKKNSKVTKIMKLEEFISNNVEHYRTKKLPSTGHFLSGDEVAQNLLYEYNEDIE